MRGAITRLMSAGSRQRGGGESEQAMTGGAATPTQQDTDPACDTPRSGGWEQVKHSSEAQGSGSHTGTEGALPDTPRPPAGPARSDTTASPRQHRALLCAALSSHNPDSLPGSPPTSPLGPQAATPFAGLPSVAEPLPPLFDAGPSSLNPQRPGSPLPALPHPQHQGQQQQQQQQGGEVVVPLELVRLASPLQRRLMLGGPAAPLAAATPAAAPPGGGPLPAGASMTPEEHQALLRAALAGPAAPVCQGGAAAPPSAPAGPAVHVPLELVRLPSVLERRLGAAAAAAGDGGGADPAPIFSIHEASAAEERLQLHGARWRQPAHLGPGAAARAELLDHAASATGRWLLTTGADVLAVAALAAANAGLLWACLMADPGPRMPYMTAHDLDSRYSYPPGAAAGKLAAWLPAAAPALALLPPALAVAAAAVWGQWRPSRICAAFLSLLAAVLTATALAAGLAALAPQPRPCFRALCWPDGHVRWRSSSGGAAAAGPGGGYPLCSSGAAAQRYAISAFPDGELAAMAAGWLLLAAWALTGPLAPRRPSAPAGTGGDLAEHVHASAHFGDPCRRAHICACGHGRRRQQPAAAPLVPAQAAPAGVDLEAGPLTQPLLGDGDAEEGRLAHPAAGLAPIGCAVCAGGAVGRAGTAAAGVPVWEVVACLVRVAAALAVGAWQVGAWQVRGGDAAAGLLLAAGVASVFAWLQPVALA